MKKLLQQALDALEDCVPDSVEMLAARVETYGENFRPVRLAAIRKSVSDAEATIEALRAAIAQPAPYDQASLELCPVCCWKTVVPGEPCLMCERNAKMLQPESEPCHCDAMGIGEPGVTCGDCPRDYKVQPDYVPLTDRQIYDCFVQSLGENGAESYEEMIATVEWPELTLVARAVERAVREAS